MNFSIVTLSVWLLILYYIRFSYHSAKHSIPTITDIIFWEITIMKNTKHKVQKLATLKDAKKIWYTKTYYFVYLFLCELKPNGKRVVNNNMLSTAWLCQLFEHQTNEKAIIYINNLIEVWTLTFMATWL